MAFSLFFIAYFYKIAKEITRDEKLTGKYSDVTSLHQSCTQAKNYQLNTISW
jgi:hypothetical protein